MESIELVRRSLNLSSDRVLARVEDMQAHCVVFPTARGGGHTLWVLGHLAYIEALVVCGFMRGLPNPLAGWEGLFDGDEVDGDPGSYPPFADVLATCRAQRASTLEFLESLAEADLDRASASVPKGYEDDFGTWRSCLQYVADHWYMHRGQLADARRAAGLGRIWV